MKIMETTKMGGQVKKVLDYLMTGEEIDRAYSSSVLRVEDLRNRISDLRNKEGWPIYDKKHESKPYYIYWLNMDRRTWPQVDENGVVHLPDKRYGLSYWVAFFSGMPDALGQDCSKAMNRLYEETSKDYSEIWPEPGTSIFEPIYDKHGYKFTPPNKK